MAGIDGIELLQLVCDNQFKPRWESYTLDDLNADEVRVVSELTAAKHGTEKGEITGDAIYMHTPMAPGNVFDRSQTNSYDPSTWKQVGNTTVGTVMAVGRDVKDLKEGDRVYRYGGFRTVHQGSGFKVLPTYLSPEAACCLDPAEFAMAAVRDAQIRIGERVIVFGMGAIGLFTVQLARLSGAVDVVAADPVDARRDLALQHGATMAVDPNDIGDFGMASREWFEHGADVTIEASGNHHALNQALRAACYRGRVVPLAFYLGDAKGLYLGEEFHFNQLEIISARACSHPQRELYWNESRIVDTLTRLFEGGSLHPYGLPDPIVSMDELPDTYGKIKHAPDEVVKVAVRY